MSEEQAKYEATTNEKSLIDALETALFWINNRAAAIKDYSINGGKGFLYGREIGTIEAISTIRRELSASPEMLESEPIKAILAELNRREKIHREQKECGDGFLDGRVTGLMEAYDHIKETIQKFDPEFSVVMDPSHETKYVPGGFFWRG